MEAAIYPVAINLDKDDTVFSRSFFYETPNCLLDHLNVNAELAGSLRLINVAAFRPGHHLEPVMDDEKSHALALLARDAIKAASK